MTNLSVMRLLRQHLIQNPQRWLRLALVIGVLLLSAMLPVVASQRIILIGLVILPVGVGFVLAFLRWPPLGLIVASVAGMVVPVYGPSGLTVTMVLVALLMGLWLLDMMVSRHQIRLGRSRAVWPLLAFVVIAFLSFGVGQLPWFNFALHAPLGAQLGGLSIIVFSVGAFLLVANQMNDLRWLSRMTWVFLALSLLFILFRSVLPTLGLPTQRFFQPMGSVFFLWVVALAFSQAVFNGDLHPGWRLALGGLVLITVYVLFILKFADKSGWIPIVICIAAIIGLRSWRVALALAPVAALAAWYLSKAAIGSDEYSVATRYDALIIMAQIIKTNPIWGLGFANYYFYTPLFPIRGYAVSFNSHNNYVDIVAQTGLVGLICFLGFMWTVGTLGWRLRDRAPAGFARAYVYGAFGGLAGTVVVGMLGDWVLPFFYNVGLYGFRSSVLSWMFLGGLVSLQQIVRVSGSRK